jgi:F-type H+-transporting ATPase subunit epsilon
MSEKDFPLRILTAERSHPARAVRAVDVPAAEGRLTVLARHQPLVVALRAGRVRIRPATGAPEEWRTEEGVMTVGREGVTLAVASAVRITPADGPSTTPR